MRRKHLCAGLGLAFVVCVAGALAWAPAARAQTAPSTFRLAPASGTGVVRALVIGIDDYRTVRPLAGAVADARDLERVLRRGGVTDLAVLLDAAARREAVLAALSGLADRARRGDLVILTFAGHGTRLEERVKGSKPDGLDEAFVLWGYAESGADQADHLLNREVYEWLRRLAEREVDVIVLADSCHGGGLTKDVSPGARTRGLFRSTGLPGGVLPSNVAGLARSTADAVLGTNLSIGWVDPRNNATLDFPNLTFLAAVDARRTVDEVEIDGQYRGAASYALARALEGAADRGDQGNGDGVVTRHELFWHVRRDVRVRTNHLQAPVVEPRSRTGADKPLFRVRDQAAVHQAVAIGGRAPSLSGQQVAWPKSVAYDATRQALIAEDGRVLLPSRPADAVGPARETLVLIERLRHRLTADRQLPMEVQPGRPVRTGDAMQLAIPGLLYGRHLIVVNLAIDGRVTLLFPTERIDGYWQQDHLAWAMTAGPQGFDTLLVLALDRADIALETDLAGLSGKVRPLELGAILERALGPRDRLGIAAYETRAP
jgi:hypothetical protein